MTVTFIVTSCSQVSSFARNLGSSNSVCRSSSHFLSHNVAKPSTATASRSIKMTASAASSEEEQAAEQRRWTKDDAAEVRERFKMWPLDEYNTRLLDEVHPKVWPSSTNDDDGGDTVYDLVVIGAGAGGLVSSRQAARRGAKSVMVSAQLAGGDCLNVGCVPSKALIRSAKMIREVKRAHAHPELGILGGPVTVDFPAIMRRMRKLRAKIAPVDGHALGTDIGVKVVQGFGRFVDANTVEVVDGTGKSEQVLHRLRFKKAVVATGGRATVPNIEGLVDKDKDKQPKANKVVPYTTNETLFNLSKLPPRMVILGSGVVALEMAQTFSAFGSEVTVLMRGERLFPRVDEDVGSAIRKALEEDGVTFLTATVTKVETLREAGVGDTENGDKDELPLLKVSLLNEEEEVEDEDSQRYFLECECLLVATGRTPNVEHLNLEAANVVYSPGGGAGGVMVNDNARSTSNPNVYSVGDCTAGVKRLTHVSGEMAKVVVQNALFDDDWRLSDLVVPACMYTEPEYASVGVTAAVNENDEVDTYVASLEHNDRAILEDEVDTKYGFVKIFTKKGTGTIVGCVIVASRAGELINEVTLAMKHGVPLEGIGRNIHCYPTTGEAVMWCGLQLINSKWKRLD